MTHTAGTTGYPKGAITSNSNLYWNTVSAIETFEINSNDVHLCAFPAYLHPHESIARAILSGGTIALAPTTAEKIAEAILLNSVTCMMANPSVYYLVFTYLMNRAKTVNTIRLAESGGSSTPVALQNLSLEVFGTYLTPVWGSTETTGMCFVAKDFVSRNLSNCLGSLAPYYKARLLDDNGNEVPDNVPGELWISGPAVVPGYYSLEKVSNEKFVEGWYRTEDVVIRDGNLFVFKGRKQDMIKMSGLKVYPIEVENVIRGMIQIADVVVIGIADEKRGEAVAAVIELKENATISIREIVDFCKDKLDKYKIPNHFRIVDKLPVNSAGKIDRNAARLLF